jgi:muramoyltetrapeptide carboxypeptidase
MKIGIVAASSRYSRAYADQIEAHVARRYPDGEVSLVFHPACFSVHGHFAGDDALRARAFLEFANDPRLDAIWFARGGYGSCRVVEAIVAGLKPEARNKRYLGYSDAGTVLAALYKLGFPNVAHGPMTADVGRGAATADRALDWLTKGAASSLEPNLDGRPTAAFNLTILDQLTGTAFEPDLTGHVVMVEEIGEALYRIDRTFCHLTSQPSIRKIAGLRLGRVSDITPNEPDFGLTPEEIARYWCARAGIAWLGTADIGHDADNKVVPFGISR